MAYYEVLIAMIFLVLTLFTGYMCGVTIGRKEVQVTDYQDGYKEGFETAKKLFYEDPKKEQILEEKRKIEEVKKANEVKPQITSEMLMAYGVENTSQLPKYVRDYYNCNTDLKTLIKEEIDVDRD